MELNEQQLQRRQALDKLRSLGIDPYPADVYPKDFSSVEISNEFDHNPDKFQQISFAGRMMRRRIMGKASFAELQDEQGRFRPILIGTNFALRKINPCTTMSSRRY